MIKFSLVIPTLNAGSSWKILLDRIQEQSVQPQHKILLDSGSSDSTVINAKGVGFDVYNINEFNHGLTRNLGMELAGESEFVIFMTQDAVLMNNMSFEFLLEPFENKDVAVVYGRQIAREDANGVERFMRMVNYPEKSLYKSMEDKESLGLKTPFCSNSFSAYRKADLLESGNFKATNFGEDMLAAATLLMAGKKVVYCAKAQVIHSHNENIFAVFKRGMAIGRMHKINPWLYDEFGKPEKAAEGLIKKAYNEMSLKMFIFFIIFCVFKYTGFKLGRFIQ